MSKHIILISLTWLAWTAQASNSNIHTSMSTDDLRSVFHVDHIDDVPSYQIVPLEEIRRNKRETASSSDEDAGGTRKMRLEAFGNRIDLVLKPNKGLIRGDKIRMWNAVADANSTDGMQYEEIVENDSEPLGEIYQDEDNMAAFLIRKDTENGGIIVEGSVGEDLIIRPLPPAYRNSSLDQHVVIKRDANERIAAGDYEYMEPDRLHKRYTRAIKTKRSAPYIIYPEILVIVDYDGYRLHGGDNLQVKRYFVSFWNGVDLRYRLLKGPRVRISIAGIIISRGRDATPYLERNRVGRDAIDSAAALTDMGKYLFRERRLPVYDIAVAITKLDMCRRQYANDACNRGTAGFAYVGGACVVNKRLEKVNSVAIIEDTGGFSGIIVAAHEVGHLLGAVHDGSPPPSYLGGPGAEKCRWEDGYIMSDLRHTERGFRWSPCSVQSFHHFLNGDTASCLHNPPHEDEALARALPGTLLSLDAQCRRDRGTSACFKDERVCSQLFCFDAASGYCVAYRPAAEGSPCGDGQHCLDGRCVAEHENIIPDYSQHTPSYIRPQTSQFRYTTEAYQPQNTNPPQTTRNYASYYTSTERPTTQNPYAYFQNQYSPTTTRQPPVINFHYYSQNPHSSRQPFYQYSTTRNPYDFHDFGQPQSQRAPIEQSRNQAYENYLKRLSQSTTRNPYNFDNFGKSYTKSTPSPQQLGGQHGNYLKRSYDTHFYWDPSETNQRNATRLLIDK